MRQEQVQEAPTAAAGSLIDFDTHIGTQTLSHKAKRRDQDEQKKTDTHWSRTEREKNTREKEWEVKQGMSKNKMNVNARQNGKLNN